MLDSNNKTSADQVSADEIVATANAASSGPNHHDPSHRRSKSLSTPRSVIPLQSALRYQASNQRIFWMRFYTFRTTDRSPSKYDAGV